MAKKSVGKRKSTKKGTMSLADIQAESERGMDISSLPEELQLVMGAAKDSAETGQRGPEVWTPIWNQRNPVKPYDDGTRFRVYEWRLEQGESNAMCVIAQLPLPIVVHTVNIGRGETKGRAYFRREKIRCLGLRYGIDSETKAPKVMPTGIPCLTCGLLGDRWSIIQVGGVVDLRKQKEPLVDQRGIRYDQPPRMLALDNDSSQRAVGDGLRERFLRGKPAIGTVFKVQRGMEQNSARIGTNWVAQLDLDTPADQIAEIYYPIDINMCYPLLDGKQDNVFKADKHEEMLLHILQRHVAMCVKHTPGKGFDAHAAKQLGLNVEASTASDDDAPALRDTPASRGLSLIHVDDTPSGGTETPTPGLTDLGDKIEEEEEPEGEEGEEQEAEEEEEGEEEEETIEELEKRLLDKEQTTIAALVAEAQETGVELQRDAKGKVKRKATTAAVVAYWEAQHEEEGGEGEEGEPWSE